MNTIIKKQFEIDQPIGVVWKNLSNPEEIVVCVPGAAITEKVDDNNYKGEVVTKFGPIKAAYAGDIGIVSMDHDNYKMQLKGRGLDSKGKGSADMVMNGALSEVNGKTQVDFSMDITIVGKLAQFGSRLINDVSDQLLNQFVTNFSNKLAADNPAVSAAAETSSSDAPAAEKVAKPAAPPVDNALDATSLAGTVVKSIFGGIIDAIKSLFRSK